MHPFLPKNSRYQYDMDHTGPLIGPLQTFTGPTVGGLIYGSTQNRPVQPVHSGSNACRFRFFPVQPPDRSGFFHYAPRRTRVQSRGEGRGGGGLIHDQPRAVSRPPSSLFPVSTILMYRLHIHTHIHMYVYIVMNIF